MDTQYIWKEEFNIGIDLIDQEHRQLFETIHKLFSFTQKKSGWAGGKNSRRACRKGIELFKEHAVKHFADEEAYMEAIDYAGIVQHKRIHKGFRENTLPALERELELTDYSPEAVEHFVGVCVGWLIGHTTTEDQAITGKCEEIWENLLPGEEIANMRKVIGQFLHRIFSLRPKLVSDVYNGEKFGNGLYYRLIYETNQEKKHQEILLAFEERLLYGTIGNVMDKRTGRLNTALLHAARHTMQRFADRVMNNFLRGKTYTLKEEHLLSYGQFQEIFETQKPMVSLLFDTGKGYLACCIMTPQDCQQPTKTEMPHEEEQALHEVAKYLMEWKTRETMTPKKKILLVDDSATIRQTIKELLSEEYEVETVESGIAAIRAVSLNPPDLVLLDYDMPICNGKQTFELLHSEKSSADVPVIFFTSKSDSDTVREVLSLNPAGYLLKSLKQADIKKRIENFFI